MSIFKRLNSKEQKENKVPIVEKKWVNAINPNTKKLQKAIYYVATKMVKFSEKEIYHIDSLNNVTYL